MALLVAVPVLTLSLKSVATNFGPTSDPSVQTVNLSSVIPNGLYMRYDSQSNLAWVSELGNSIASINLNSVISSGSSSVKSYTGIFPSTSSSVGSLLTGSIGVTLLKGLVYTDAIYSSGVALASIDPSTNATHVYYTSLASSVSTLASRGSLVFIAAGQSILVFNTATSAFSSISTKPLAVSDLLVFGNAVYFAYTNSTSGSGGIGLVNTDGTGLSTHDAGEPARMIAFDSSGGIWFTAANDLVEWDGSSFHHYQFESQSLQGPVGLVATPAGISVWGNEYNVVRFFQFSQSGFNPSLDVKTGTLNPRMGIIDANGNVWGFALGSFTLMEIFSAEISTVTSTTTSLVTTTVTSTPTTTVTKTTTATSTSSTTQTVTTTVTSTTATTTITTTVTATSISGYPHQACGGGDGDGNGDWHGQGDQNGNGNGDECGGDEGD